VSHSAPCGFVAWQNGGSTIEDAGKAVGYKWGKYKFDCDASGPNANVSMIHERCFETEITKRPHNEGCSVYHLPRGWLINHPRYGPDPYANAKTFCVVRNPFDRTVSQYIYQSLMRAGGCSNYHDLRSCPRWAFQLVCQASKLNAYVNARFDPTKSWMPNELQRLTAMGTQPKSLDSAVSEDCHWLPQWLHVGGDNQPQMCNHVLHLESLDSDLQKVVDRYPQDSRLARLPKAISAQMNSMSTSEHCQLSANDLSPASVQQLAHVYEKDFRLLGYSSSPSRPNASSHPRGMTGVFVA